MTKETARNAALLIAKLDRYNMELDNIDEKSCGGAKVNLMYLYADEKNEAFEAMKNHLKNKIRSIELQIKNLK